MTPEEEELLKKQDAEQATPVSNPMFVNETVKEVRESGKIAAPGALEVQEAKILAEGCDSDFWRLIRKKLETRVKDMRTAQSTRMASGPINLQDVGLRSLIINEIADAFTDLINLVEEVKLKQDIPEDESTDPIVGPEN